MRTRILIYRMGALGDTLLLSLLFNHLHTHYENPHITLAANTAYAAPLLDAGLIDKVLDGAAPPFHLLYDDRPTADDALSRFIEGYDICAFYTADRSGELGRRLATSRRGEYQVHPPFPPEGERVHICEWMMRPWPFGGGAASQQIKLNPSQHSLDIFHKFSNKYGIHEQSFFILHPGGGSERKWVPPDILAGRARKYGARTGHQPVLVEGPADAAASGRFLRLWGGSIPVIREVSPKILGVLLSKSSAYFGGDSGVSHLASLYAPRATILYGPHADMQTWHPVGAHTRCVPWEPAG